MFLCAFASPTSVTSRTISISPPGSLNKSSIPIFSTFQCWFSLEISCSMFYLGHLCHLKPSLIFKARKSTDKPSGSLGLLSTISTFPRTLNQCLSGITTLAKIWWTHTTPLNISHVHLNVRMWIDGMNCSYLGYHLATLMSELAPTIVSLYPATGYAFVVGPSVEAHTLSNVQAFQAGSLRGR